MLPSGTVTFLFTDIEGSTSLAQKFSTELPLLLARHHAILLQAVEAHHGYIFQIVGDVLDRTQRVMSAAHDEPAFENACKTGRAMTQEQVIETLLLEIRG
jgi:class 3 adenylate cyclase